MPRPKRSPVIALRRLSQIGFLLLVGLIGCEFGVWALAFVSGHPPSTARPAGVEGFLPISALMSLRLWLAGEGVHPVHPAGLAIFVAIVAMSAVIAKSFCSHICPIGTVSEGLGRLGARLSGRLWVLPRWLDVPLRALKYLLLAFFLWATWVALDVAGVRAFLDSPYNRVADTKMFLFFAHPSRLTVAVLGVLAVGSMFIRDLWCRYLCPYGALLGLLGRLAPLKVTRDPAACTECGKCTEVCPARLRVHAMTRVASVECTSCQDCVTVCPVKACLAVRPPRPVPLRVFLRPALVVGLAIAVYLATTAGFRVSGHWRGMVSEREYAERLREIDSPLYTHVAGIAAAGGMSGSSTPARSHGGR